MPLPCRIYYHGQIVVPGSHFSSLRIFLMSDKDRRVACPPRSYGFLYVYACHFSCDPHHFFYGKSPCRCPGCISCFRCPLSGFSKLDMRHCQVRYMDIVPDAASVRSFVSSPYISTEFLLPEPLQHNRYEWVSGLWSSPVPAYMCARSGKYREHVFYAVSDIHQK